MKGLLRFLIVLSLLLPSVPAAHAVRFIDQLQPAIDHNSGAHAIGGSSEQKLAQTVTVGNGRRLTGVLLPIACTNGVLEIEIQELDAEGRPNGVVLAHRDVEAAALPSSVGFGSFVFVSLRTTVPVRSGQRLAIVLKNLKGSCGLAQSPIGDTYSGGQGFFDARPNSEGWIPLFSGPLDLPFQTLVRSP